MRRWFLCTARESYGKGIIFRQKHYHPRHSFETSICSAHFRWSMSRQCENYGKKLMSLFTPKKPCFHHIKCFRAFIWLLSLARHTIWKYRLWLHILQLKYRTLNLFKQGAFEGAQSKGLVI